MNVTSIVIGNGCAPQYIDPGRPWMRRSGESNQDLSCATQEAVPADFNARQLDLFRPEAEWDNGF
jgi:hypothetical protein